MKTPTAGKDFWVARATEDWSWGVWESSPRWQGGRGFGEQRCNDSPRAAAHSAALMLQIITPPNQIWGTAVTHSIMVAQGLSHNDPAMSAEEKTHGLVIAASALAIHPKL